MKDLELYIHIPFCIRKCDYCDFLSFSCQEEERQDYVETLCEEIQKTADYMQKKQGWKGKISTVFIGGGTPSILTVRQISQIMETIKECFDLSSDAEITIESNPGTLDAEKLYTYKKLGINRLSIGLQSAENRLLKKLGRIHSYEDFYENYEQAKRAGFENINIDLMSALPGQKVKDYEKTLDQILALEPAHISAYSLIIEEGTPFYDDDEILNQLPDEEEERFMYDLTEKKLLEKGYHRYEISNYAKVDKKCKHNLGYWSDKPYLGFGLGASSYYDHARFQNTTDMQTYMTASFLPFEERDNYHILTKEEHMEEYMFLGLRKMEGVSVKEFEEIFHTNILDIYGSVMKEHMQQGLLEKTGERIRLTKKGVDVCNRVMSDFLLSC